MLQSNGGIKWIFPHLHWMRIQLNESFNEFLSNILSWHGRLMGIFTFAVRRISFRFHLQWIFARLSNSHITHTHTHTQTIQETFNLHQILSAEYCAFFRTFFLSMLYRFLKVISRTLYLDTNMIITFAKCTCIRFVCAFSSISYCV